MEEIKKETRKRLKKRQLQLIATLMATDKSFKYKYKSCSDLKKKKKLNHVRKSETQESRN